MIFDVTPREKRVLAFIVFVAAILLLCKILGVF